MSVRAALLLALLVLALPAVRADGNVTLTADADVRSESVPAGADVILSVTYTLELDISGDVMLRTRVDAAGTSLDHSAGWSGSDLGGTHATSRADEAFADDLPTDRPLAFTIQYVLPAATAAGTYDLRAFVFQRSGTGGDAQLADNDAALTRVQLNRPSGSSGGGGGGAGGGAGPSLGPVTGLSAHSIEATSLHLGWTSAGTGVTYEVFRATSPGFEPTASNRVGSTAELEFADNGLTPGTAYHYRVRGTIGSTLGPFSAELAVVTRAAPDTSAPSVVTGLAVTKATASSVALSWTAASDDQRVAAYNVFRGEPGFTPSLGNQVGSTAGLVFTDGTVQAGRTYAYIVRAVDAAGNIGPASAPVQATTTVADATPPAVTRVVLSDGGSGWRLQWNTDERATASVAVSGPGAPRTLSAPAGVTFSIALGDLPLGLHELAITATSDAGLAATRTVRFTVEAGLHGRLEFVGDAVADALGTSLGVDVDANAVYFVDAEADGQVDRVDDASGTLRQDRAFPAERRFLLAAGARLALLGTDGTVAAVEPVDGDVLRSADGNAVRRVTVEVADKDGWIAVSLADPAPGLPLLGVERSDGSSLPVGFAWRERGTVRFLDDPAAEYVLLYDRAGLPDDEAGKGGLPGWLPYVAGAVGIVLGMLLMAVLMRRRKA